MGSTRVFALRFIRDLHGIQCDLKRSLYSNIWSYIIPSLNFDTCYLLIGRDLSNKRSGLNPATLQRGPLGTNAGNVGNFVSPNFGDFGDLPPSYVRCGSQSRGNGTPATRKAATFPPRLPPFLPTFAIFRNWVHEAGILSTLPPILELSVLSFEF